MVQLLLLAGSVRPIPPPSFFLAHNLHSTGTQMTSRTFMHLTAGSTTIMPSGKIITFGGKKGGHGVYETADAAEIAWLESLAKQRLGQTMEVSAEAGAATPMPVVDPTIAAAAADAAANALKVADTPPDMTPEMILAAELAKLAAGG